MSYEAHTLIAASEEFMRTYCWTECRFSEEEEHEAPTFTKANYLS